VSRSWLIPADGEAALQGIIAIPAFHRRDWGCAETDDRGPKDSSRSPDAIRRAASPGGSTLDGDRPDKTAQCQGEFAVRVVIAKNIGQSSITEISGHGACRTSAHGDATSNRADERRWPGRMTGP